jgi:hypothetical protein
LTDLRITHIGGPTVLIQFGGWRLLTDPTFDPPGQKYNFGWGTGSVKLAGPAVAASELRTIDAVLLTHDHHEDKPRPCRTRIAPISGRRRHDRPWLARRLEHCRGPGLKPARSTAQSIRRNHQDDPCRRTCRGSSR